MATTDTNSAEELVQAYNQAISSSFAAVDAGMAQATAAAKVVTEAVQTERDQYGKVVEQAAGHARARGENAVGVMQSMAGIPATGATTYADEAKKSVSKLIEGEMAFYQAWTKGWMDYLTGIEERRSAASKAVLESNVKMLESSQEVAKSAAKYGEALMQWSLDNAKGTKS